MTSDADAESRYCERAAKLPPEKQPTHGNGDAAGEASEVTRLVKILRSAEAIARKLKPAGHMGDEEAGCDRECRACFHDQLMGALEDALARHDGESRAIPGRAGDRIAKALVAILEDCDLFGEPLTSTMDDARAAISEISKSHAGIDAATRADVSNGAVNDGRSDGTAPIPAPSIVHEAITDALHTLRFGPDDPGWISGSIGLLEKAEAALAERRGGDDTEVVHAVAQMAAHDRDEALVRAMRAEKQLADRDALLSQVRSELDAMTNDRDQARRRLTELERAEEVRDAVCEERNMLAKRIGEMEAALAMAASRIDDLRDFTDSAKGLATIDGILEALGKRGGGTMRSGEGA